MYKLYAALGNRSGPDNGIHFDRNMEIGDIVREILAEATAPLTANEIGILIFKRVPSASRRFSTPSCAARLALLNGAERLAGGLYRLRKSPNG